MTSPQVHDLLRIDPKLAATWSGAPAWVEESLRRAPWVVVRRVAARDAVPVGVRGANRAQRFATFLDPADVITRLEPADLVPRAIAGGGVAGGRLYEAARAVDASAHALGVQWAPAGAFAFELAAGIAVTHAASDLDIVIAAGPMRATLHGFAATCTELGARTGVRIDAEVCFGTHGIALDELLSGATRVLAKTPAGPRLVGAPS